MTLAIFAHDFNNTLMPIIGFSNMLLSDPSALDDREEVRHMLEKIHAAGLVRMS